MQVTGYVPLHLRSSIGAHSALSGRLATFTLAAYVVMFANALF